MKLVSVYKKGNGSTFAAPEPGSYTTDNIARVTRGIVSEYAMECVWKDESDDFSEGFASEQYRIEPLMDNGFVFGHALFCNELEIFACMLKEYA